MDAAPLDAGEIIIVPVHKMHSPDKQGIPVKFAERLKVLPDERLADNLPELGGVPLLTLLHGIMHIFYPFQQSRIFVDGAAFFEFVSHLFD